MGGCLVLGGESRAERKVAVKVVAKAAPVIVRKIKR